VLAAGQEVGRGWLLSCPQLPLARSWSISQASHPMLHPQRPGPAQQAAPRTLPPASRSRPRPAPAPTGPAKLVGSPSGLLRRPKSNFFARAVSLGRLLAAMLSLRRSVSPSSSAWSCLHGQGQSHRRPRARDAPVHLTVMHNTIHLPSRALCSWQPFTSQV